MEFFRQFGLLFANMEWYIIVCLILGIVLLLIEIFQPGFGIFGIVGLILLALAIIMRAIFHKSEDNVVMQIFQLLLLIIIIAGGAFGFFMYANKKNWLKKNAVFSQEDTAVSTDFSEGTENFTNLIGHKGVAMTDLRPSGKAIIDGIPYDVVAQNFFIEKDTKIIVKAVEGVKIEVTAIIR